MGSYSLRAGAMNDMADEKVHEKRRLLRSESFLKKFSNNENDAFIVDT